MNIDKGKLLFVALAFGALALFPFFGGKFGVDLVTKIMIFAIFALSLRSEEHTSELQSQ